MGEIHSQANLPSPTPTPTQTSTVDHDNQLFKLQPLLSSLPLPPPPCPTYELFLEQLRLNYLRTYYA